MQVPTHKSSYLLWVVLLDFSLLSESRRDFFYPEEINTNSVIGSEGEIMNNRRIKVNGTEWNYKTENGRPIKAGAQAMVLSQKGSTLLVKSISKMKNN